MEPDGAGAARHERLRYVPALDGLRAFAIALVLLFHMPRWFDNPRTAGPLIPGGYLGVDVFFLISGFLITSLLLDERATSGMIRLRAFWGRRIARLFPLLVCLLLVVAFAKWVHDIPGIVPPTPRGFLAVMGYVGNWIPALHHRNLGTIEFTWSLAVEEQFYLFWPLVVTTIVGSWTATRRSLTNRHRIIVAVVALSGAVVGALARAVYWTRAVGWNAHNPYMYLAVAHHRAHAWDGWFFSTVFRADGLLLGAALAATRHLWQPWVSRRWALVLGFVGAAITIWAVVNSEVVLDPNIATWKLPLLEVGVALTVAAVVAIPATPLGRALRWTPFVWLGRRSYALYLVHIPVFVVIDAVLEHSSRGLRFGLSLVLAVLVAHLAHILIELPAQRRLRVVLRAEHTPADTAPETVG